jgi:predicted Fe-S protein YdhL (DUF1289 family)
MALFPKVQRPCPYKSQLASVMDGDFCRMCQREVVDLTAWSDDERVAFLSACKEEVCVSYRIRPAIAAAALAAAAIPTAAAAQDQAAAPAPVAAVSTDEIGPVEQEDYVIVGGIRDPANAELVSAEELAATPEVPVTYEDEEPAPAAGPGA